MAVNKFATEYVLEIQNTEKSEGFLCRERVIVKAHNEGGGVFLSIKADNLEPTDEYDSHTVTLSRNDLNDLFKHLEQICAEHENFYK